MVTDIPIITVTVSTFNISRAFLAGDLGASLSEMWGGEARTRAWTNTGMTRSLSGTHGAGPACREVQRFLGQVKRFP